SIEENPEIPPDVSDEKKSQAQKILRDLGEQGLDDDSYREAYDCISRGEDEKGLLKVREFIEHHPKVWNGWFLLGWALRKLGRYKDGLEAFRKAMDLGGASSDTLNEMAICLMELGDLKGARKELEAALREDPENIKIISNLGVLAQKSGRPQEAAAFFRTVLELDPDDPVGKSFGDWGLGTGDWGRT
ncbi:MAG: tetratricopeptide repeat protein, partial [Treponema sp.]|nr:tetratricopeptide repeat protein [Treponema sp.]